MLAQARPMIFHTCYNATTVSLARRPPEAHALVLDNRNSFRKISDVFRSQCKQ